MLHRERVRVIITIAAVGASLALKIGLAAAQNPPQPSPAGPLNQQSGDKQKPPQQRREAQAERQSREVGEDPIKIPTEMVQLDVKVTDHEGRPVSGLTKDDFAVYEDKVSQSIESVSSEEAAVSLGLAIDSSGSMRPKLYTVSDAARGLIRLMRPDDETFLVLFNTEAVLVQEFTSDHKELEEALRRIYSGGGTALLDTIIAVADHAREKGRLRRKALVVITDGLEKNSSSKEKAVIEAMKKDEVQLYLVGLVEDGEGGWPFGRSAGGKGKDLLNRLAEDSGGRAFFPTDVKETPAIAEQIAKDLRAQYVISYYPNNDRRDGSFHSVRVVVNNSKLIARTRHGYYTHNN
ncbi:MAG: VWA domain-containing protein [Chloracidobacterium sp.]|nr:VWA domain-containing protein [Chloracidobacterium sp.]